MPLFEQARAPTKFLEDEFDGTNVYMGLATNANTSVQNWAVKLDATAYSLLRATNLERPEVRFHQAHPTIRFIANALELYATQHAYNQCGVVNSIHRIAPTYHRLTHAMKSVAKPIKEHWFRPNLE